MCFPSDEIAIAKSLQSCLTLWDPIDSSPPARPSPPLPVPGTLQARTLEWAAISFSSAGKQKVKVKSLSQSDLATPWTAAYQAPPSMGFSRQEYWSGVPLPPPSDEISLCKNLFARKAGLYYEECSGHISNGLFSPPLPETWGDFPFGSSWWESCKVSGSRIHKVRPSLSLWLQGDSYIHWIPNSLSDCVNVTV